jgi:hypothetical protein
MDLQDKCPKSVKHCNYPGCKAVSTQRCSRCKKAYYCSVEHQKENWKAHKILCSSFESIKEVKIEKIQEASPVNDKKDTGEEFFKEKNSDASDAGGKRQSRCMFCGEQLVLESEEDAVYHMRICPALQEQLASPDQFTIPTMLREENNIPVPKKT